LKVLTDERRNLLDLYYEQKISAGGFQQEVRLLA
jgi:hypothetical protein